MILHAWAYIHCGQMSTPPRTVPPRLLASQMYLRQSLSVDDKFTLSTLLPRASSVIFTSSCAASLMTSLSIARRSVLPTPVWVNTYQTMWALGSPLPLHPMWIMVCSAVFVDDVFPCKVAVLKSTSSLSPWLPPPALTAMSLSLLLSWALRGGRYPLTMDGDSRKKLMIMQYC